MRAPRLAFAFVLALGTGAAATSVSTQAHAQQTQAAPPDVVKLKNGGILRGTIAELVPGGTVTIVTMTGETKKIPMAEVQYAGPAAGMPGAAPPATPAPASGPRPLIQVNGRDAPLYLRSSQSEVTFYMRTSTSEGSSVSTGAMVGSRGFGAVGGGTSVFSGRTYARICTAPCEATVPAGQYTLALSKGTGNPVEDEQLVRVDGPATLAGKYTSYAGLRAAGFVITLASVVTGFYLIFTSFGKEECDAATNVCDRKVDQSRLFTGLGVTIGGAIIGGIMGSKGDDAEIRVIPGATGAIAPRNALWANERGAAAVSAPLPGLTLAATF